MADAWYELASIDHFWVRRRFTVLQALAAPLITASKAMAEIGCGHGIVQRQIELAFGRCVDGFDLNEFALRNTLSRLSRVCCYNIFDRLVSLRAAFDLMFLFDVLEHIDAEDDFLQAVLFHLRPGGYLIVNVPAGQWLFSNYDRAAGHLRRYSIGSLWEVAVRNHLVLRSCTYWGLPLIPLLLIRKLMLRGRSDPAQIIQSGFDMRGPVTNNALGSLSALEPIPQKALGTSVLAVFSIA
jgi:SAM-dependent methyltransferase